jgi:hypothetical protein
MKNVVIQNTFQFSLMVAEESNEACDDHHKADAHENATCSSLNHLSLPPSSDTHSTGAVW